MDTELLKTFLEVQKTRHFGKAADNLYLTQSAVSFRIRQLEQSLGVTLFNRFRNNIQLTTAGEMLLPHAQAVLSAISTAKQQIALNYHPERPLQLCISSELSILFAEKSFSEMVSTVQKCQLQFIPTELFSRQSQLGQDGMVLLGNALPEPQPWQELCLGYLQLVPVAVTGSESTAEAALGLAKVPRIQQNPVQFSCANPDVVLQWLLANNASAYLPLMVVQDGIAQKQLQRLALPDFKIAVWAYSPVEAQWPMLWRTILQGASVLQSSP